MLDGGAPIPGCELVLADGLHHPVKDAVQKILANGGTRLPVRRGDNAVDETAKINFLIDLVGQPDRAEFFHL